MKARRTLAVLTVDWHSPRCRCTQTESIPPPTAYSGAGCLQPETMTANSRPPTPTQHPEKTNEKRDKLGTAACLAAALTAVRLSSPKQAAATARQVCQKCSGSAN